jgi:hypothetical protein
LTTGTPRKRQTFEVVVQRGSITLTHPKSKFRAVYAAYLNNNIREIKYDTSGEEYPPEPMRG